MRKLTTLFATTVAALTVTAAPALAMQPPGEPDPTHFGCDGGNDSAVAGHPGATGLLDAAPLVAGLTGDTSPTAWNAVDHADPITSGTC
jgi:hypothetical protein